jgi:octaprenyl-diphosphate synthase
MEAKPAEDLGAIYAPIGEELEGLRRYLEEEFSAREPFIGRILDHVSRFGGKQLRPALLFLVSRLAGAQPTRDHIKIAAVVELIHTATLVHDDILDDAVLRRSMATVHRRWGERAGVLIGDFIYSRAFNISTEVAGMARILSDTAHTVCEGELLQIESRFRPDIGEARYLEIIRKKTAILYAVSCELGGVLGGLDLEQCRWFHRFGMDLGMAFQIVDDCLDYTGKESVAGKSLGTDLRQGKVTLPLIYLMERLTDGDGAWLREALEGPMSVESEERIHRLVEEHGAALQAMKTAARYVESAKTGLSKVVLAEVVPREAPPAEQAVRDSLEMVADYVVRRER